MSEYVVWGALALVAIVGVGLGVQLLSVAWRVYQLRRRSHIVPTVLERRYRREVRVAFLVVIGLGVGLAITLVQR